MIFTSLTFFIFLAMVLTVYWLCRDRKLQNAFLLVASYIFYGWIHPWFSLLLLIQTVTDYIAALRIFHDPKHKNAYLICSLTLNLGILCAFKYFNFFAENVQVALSALGWSADRVTVNLLLPAGISFYTFETISYTIDVYRNQLKPRTNFVDYSLFVAFFPHLVAGPIQRASQFLPQLEAPRRWDWTMFSESWPLIIRGYVEKSVIADNVAVYADKVFTLRNPSLFLLAGGTLAFSLQIYADFLGYTDIARGVSLLFGLRLSENFHSPYLAISPSDFWRRWHITFSTWIRDYLYIPLGGSRVSNPFQFAIVLFITLGLSGLWHGAQWHFVIWGLYFGAVLFLYHGLGKGGHWRPRTRGGLLIAWAITFTLVLFGWLLFRASSIGWVWHCLRSCNVGGSGDSLMAGATILIFLGYYAMPLLVWKTLDRCKPKHPWMSSVIYGLAIVWIILQAPEKGQDFIYFQF